MFSIYVHRLKDGDQQKLLNKLKQVTGYHDVQLGKYMLP